MADLAQGAVAELQLLGASGDSQHKPVPPARAGSVGGALLPVTAGERGFGPRAHG